MSVYDVTAVLALLPWQSDGAADSSLTEIQTNEGLVLRTDIILMMIDSF